MVNKITSADLEILKSQNWSYKELGEEGFIKNQFMQEVLDKSLEDINSCEPDLIFLGTWLNKIKNERSIKFSSFIWEQNKLIKKKVFPMDYEGNIFHFGLLLPKEVDNEIKGKKIGKQQILSPCLITSNRQLLEISLKTTDEFKIDFDNISTGLPVRWDLNKIREYLEGIDREVNGKELLDKIKQRYEKYLFIKNQTWYKIYSLWDIGTYLYMIFEAYPFIENRGIAGTGKSKSMNISSFISFNGGQIMANPSESTLFRETDEVRGAKYFDEAEKLFIFNPKTKQFEGDVRTELINASYTKEARVPRQEKVGNKFITKWYSPYSPTQLSSINGLYGATETRAITRICTKSPNNDNRGEKEPSEDRQEPVWAEIRDECYRFALYNWKGIKHIYNNFPKECGLKRRELQIWKPLLAIAKFISEEDYNEVLDFAIELSDMRLDDLISESSFDYMCLSALKEVVLLDSQTDKHYLDRIKEIFLSNKGDSEIKNDVYLNKNIGQHLKRLGFEKKRDNQKTYIIADKRLYDEIVSPICPQLVILATFPTLPTPFNINNKEKGVDGVLMSVDKLDNVSKKGVAVLISGESVDTCEDEGSQFNQLNEEYKKEGLL